MFPSVPLEGSRRHIPRRDIDSDRGLADVRLDLRDSSGLSLSVLTILIIAEHGIPSEENFVAGRELAWAF